MRRVILLAGSAREKSGIASAAINPGNIVEMTPGTVDSWRKHSTAGGFVFPIAIARNQHENQGHEITDAIAANDSCTVLLPELGAEVYVRCVDTVVRGDHLVSAGDGTVKKRTAETAEAPIGVATEANADGFVPMIVGGAPAFDISI
jgi:hypothetical protein